MKRPVLTELKIYPVKSLGTIALTETDVLPQGLAFDRRFMLVDSRGQSLTQREFSRMALVQTCIEGNRLRFSAPGKADLEMPLTPSGGARLDVQVFSEERVSALHPGTQFDDWFAHFLETPCRLVFMDSGCARPIHPDYAVPGETVSFADSMPVLLVSRASLELLNEKLGFEMSMARFRPNLVVTGCAPNDEDRWSRIRIGDVDLEATKNCGRCKITLVDPETGIPWPGKEPLKTLASYRRLEGNEKVYFGRYFKPMNRGHIAVGQPIEVLK